MCDGKPVEVCYSLHEILKGSLTNELSKGTISVQRLSAVAPVPAATRSRFRPAVMRSN